MNRTVENRAIAVVRTRLPYTDRRSLSQAWFSALRLASDGPSPRVARGPCAAAAPLAAGRPRPLSRGPEALRRPPPSVAAAFATGARAVPVAAFGGGVRIRSAEAPAERAANCPSARSYPPFRTSLTLGVAGDRVALLLRREGTTLHVVALCRPAVESTVRRALALAAAHVRLHGDSLRASVRTLPEDAA